MSTIDPNMGFTNPTPTSTPGPDYASDVSDALTTIGGHTHTGNGTDGKQLGAASLNIDGDISFNTTHNINSLRSARFVNQGAPLSGVNDLADLYVSGGNLWYNTTAGTQVQITNGSSLVLTGSNIAYSTHAVNGDITIAPSATYAFLLVDTSAARFITLPSAAAVAAGRLYLVCDIDGNASTHNITIYPHGVESINEADNYIINSGSAIAFLVSDGVSNWFAVTNFPADLFRAQGPILTVSATNTSSSGDIQMGDSGAITYYSTAKSTLYELLGLDGADNLTISSGGNLTVSHTNIALDGYTTVQKNLTVQGTNTILPAAGVIQNNNSNGAVGLITFSQLGSGLSQMALGNFSNAGAILCNNGIFFQQNPITASGAGPYTLNCNNGNVFTITYSHSFTFAFSNLHPGQDLWVHFIHDSSATSYTVTYPTIKLAAGPISQPTQSSNAHDIVQLQSDGINVYLIAYLKNLT